MNLKLFIAILAVASLFTQQGFAQQTPPKIPFESDVNFLKLNYQLNLGEVLGVAVNSKGTVVVLNHPGSATSGPLYGNATAQLLEFDASGKFLRELGKGVYGLGYAHSVRFDKYDNLWVVDKGTHAAMRFNPAGMVTLNLGRRPEGPDEPEYYKVTAWAGEGPRRNYFRRRSISTAISARPPTWPGTATTTSTSVTAISIRASPSSTSTETG